MSGRSSTVSIKSESVESLRKDPPLSSSSSSSSSIEAPPIPLRIDRFVIHQEEFDKTYDYHKVETSWRDALPQPSAAGCCRLTKSLLPPLEWLPEYKLSYLLTDLIAGATVSVLNVPQAMAYAALASMPPEVGLYTSFYSTILYAILGTSRHIVLGMFAVVALMVGDVAQSFEHSHGGSNSTSDTNTTTAYTTTTGAPVFDTDPKDIVAAVTLSVGIIFLVMAVLQLHLLSSYLSTHLVNGFTTAAAFHVLASQLPKVLGIHIGSHEGIFKLFKILDELFHKIGETNFSDLIISGISIGVLMFSKYLFNPWLAKKCKVPFPTELIVIVAATVSSYYFDFENTFNTKVVGDIPEGFPPPKLPDLSLLKKVFVPSIPIAIVAFGVSLSVGKLFARKHAYKINPVQELRAMSLIHFITSTVQCHPSSAGLSRCVVVSQLGSKSSIAAATSAMVVLVVILWVGKHLYSLPKCVLSAIIIVALQTMFLQVRELPRLWRISKVDFVIWLFPFVVTVLWDVTQGLVGGIIFALMTVVLRTQFAKSVSLGHIPDSELYRDETIYSGSKALKHIAMLRFDSPLLFVNCDRFMHDAVKLVASRPPNTVRHLIVDASGFTQIDQMGVEALKDLHVEMKKEWDVDVIFAAAKAPVRELFEACGLYEHVPKSLFFPSLHDAKLHLDEQDLEAAERGYHL
ncbi:prestin-like protein [Aphelenchoides avenae]|nr:prestin-like protein [Aphelenchus avenae]